MENFQKNELKKFGDFVEDEILKRIQKKYPLAYNTNKDGVVNKKCDLIIPEIQMTVESKADYVSVGTHNLLIEVFGWDGNSGLSTTESDYWVFVTGFRIIWMKPLEIYRFIEMNPNLHNGRETINGKGDTYNKLAYKIKHKEFVLYAHGLSDKNFKRVSMILDKNDPLFWFNCIKYNYDLNKYIEEAEAEMKNLNIF
jgi:hypothetical protein